MLFAILCDDREGGLDTRLATRGQHLDYLKSLGERLAFAGPFLGADEQPVGTMLVVEAADSAGAQAIADADPYARAGLFARVEVRRWNWTVNRPDGRA